MRALIQRVSKASVSIDGETVGEIEKGIVILLGVTHGDVEKDADYLAEKCANLRIFEDGDGKMNLSTIDVGGGALVVSQFTLYGDTRKGRRPSYTDAALPEKAIPLYEYFIEKVKDAGLSVATGRFGAGMDVRIHNQGPVTLMLESK